MSKLLSTQPLGGSIEKLKTPKNQLILMDHINRIQNKVSLFLLIKQPGPGSYDSSYTLVKPKGKGYSIPHAGDKKGEDR